jgi:antitoxin component YwqK of YwqJK toxin-antitoxin module
MPLKTIYFLLIFAFSLASGPMTAQNVGQRGDTLVNYIDINGMKQGKWAKNYPNGKKAYEGYFKNDQPIGTFTRYHENGQLKSIQDCSQLPFRCITQVYYRENKLAAEGNYLNQKKDSIWKYFDDKGKLIKQESFKEGVKHGMFLTYYSNGKVAEEENYEHGKKTGLWMQYYENGKKKLEAELSNGMRNGKFYMYYETGRIKVVGRYLNDMRDKTWVFYDEKGAEVMTVLYDKGKATNEDDFDDAQQKEFREYEQNKGKFQEPADFIRKQMMYDGY